MAFQPLQIYEFTAGTSPKTRGRVKPLVVDKTVDRFSEGGIIGHGFAHIRCPECREEFLLTFSCKTRYFCPSCLAKRVAAFVEWMTGAIFQEVPHRQLVWTIPSQNLLGGESDKSLPEADGTQGRRDGQI